eukprot:528014-Pyramimonas_sp.AAC.1
MKAGSSCASQRADLQQLYQDASHTNDNFEDYMDHPTSTSRSTLRWKRTGSMYIVECPGDSECFHPDLFGETCMPIYASQAEQLTAGEDFARL